jgi:hypothetical protein
MTKLNNLTELAEFLKKMGNYHPRRKVGFDMQWAYHNKDLSDHPCGSAMCIGGWVQNFNKKTRRLGVTDAVMTICPEGTDRKEVEELCYPDKTNNHENNAYRANPQQAARAVEILRDTGRTDWERAMSEVAE